MQQATLFIPVDGTDSKRPFAPLGDPDDHQGFRGDVQQGRVPARGLEVPQLGRAQQQRRLPRWLAYLLTSFLSNDPSSTKFHIRPLCETLARPINAMPLWIEYLLEQHRYHLYVSLACPWASRCLGALYLKGLMVSSDCRWCTQCSNALDRLTTTTRTVAGPLPTPLQRWR